MSYRANRTVQSLFPPGPAEDAARELADRGLNIMQGLAEAETPQRTGRLRAGWYQMGPVRRMAGGDREWRGEVRNDVDYAGYVESGTGLWGPTGSEYPIRPVSGQYLSWVTNKPVRLRSGRVIPAGTRVFRKLVMHPGSPGVGMMDKAVRTTERTMGSWSRSTMERWARRMERGGRP